MKLLERFYNWLSSPDPYMKIRLFKEKKDAQKAMRKKTSNPEFLEWAFGDNYLQMDTMERMKAWNLIHGDKHIINPREDFQDNLFVMGTLWIESINKGE